MKENLVPKDVTQSFGINSENSYLIHRAEFSELSFPLNYWEILARNNYSGIKSILENPTHNISTKSNMFRQL